MQHDLVHRLRVRRDPRRNLRHDPAPARFRSREAGACAVSAARGQAALLAGPVWGVVAAGAAALLFTVAALQLETHTRLADIADQESRPYAVLRGAV